MEYIVEIGTAEEKELIRDELKLIFDEAPKIDPHLNIREVIVPADFEAIVNRLLGTSFYHSTRNLGRYVVVPQAKVIDSPNGLFVVISPQVFNEQQDSQTRSFIYIHELIHLTNKYRFQSGDALSQSDAIYMHNLKVATDEYVADRVAYSLMDELFTVKSERWQAELDFQTSASLSALEDPTLLTSIKSSIQQLQVHHDISRFLEEVRPLFDGTFLVLVHSFALSDSYPNQLSITELTKSKLVNERALALVDYIRLKYASSTYELSDGLPIIKNVMRNFGIEFYDSPQGLVCHVDYSDF
jgi:hypothetical protein